MAARRFLLYAVNGSGMGHVTRLLAVARWLRRFGTFLDGRAPEVLFLTSSEATGVLLRAGFASFKIPSKGVVKEAGLDPLEYRRLAKHFVWNTLGTFQPDLLVVDTFPSGSFDELFQVLDGPLRKALILRDVKPEYAARPVFRAALGLYDAVVAPHATCREPPAGIAVQAAGEVLQIEREALLPREEARRALGVAATDELVYVSAGGGGDPATERTLAALVDALGGAPGRHLLVGAGPLYRGRRLGGAGLTWFTEPQVARYFGAVDVAISAAGYNTFHELLYARVPSVFYAQPKVADDQAGRIAAGLEAGACVGLGGAPTGPDLDPARVRSAVARAIEQAASLREGAARYVPDNHARRCARLLLAPIYGAEALARADGVLAPGLVHAAERLPDRGLVALGRVLPSLVPAQRLTAPGSQPVVATLLRGLSPEAAEEVRALVAQDPETLALGRLSDAFAALLELAADHPQEADRVLGTVEVALKKHPLAQEAEPEWLPWVATVCEGLRDLLTSPDAALPFEELVRLYRVAPRLVDADARTAMAAFRRFVGRVCAAAEDPNTTVRRLQALKLMSKRVTVDQLDQLQQAGR